MLASHPCPALTRPPIEFLPVAVTGLQCTILQRERVEEGRHGRAGAMVAGRPRRGRNALVPDLAHAAVLPADQMIAGFGRARGGEGGSGKTGGSAQHGNTTHGSAPQNERWDAPPDN